MLCAAAFLIVQDVLLLGDAARGVDGPVPISCGLLDAPMEGRTAWRPVGIPGGGPAVLVRTPFGPALHAVLPRVGPGATSLRLERGAGPAPPVRLTCGESGGVFESDGWGIGFERDGSIEVEGESCRLWPDAPRHGRWTVREADPVRAVLVWETAGATLYAMLHAGTRAVELTLVVKGGAGGGAAALGLEVLRAGEEPAPVAAPESRPDEAPFESVAGALGSSLWEPVERSGTGVAMLVRRFGPTSPVERPSGGRLLAVDPCEALPPGEERVLRVRLGEDARACDVLSRPARRAAPEGVGPHRLRRRLDAAISAFRADPRHGLMWRRDDLGDWRMDASRVGNLEWDTSLGFLRRFFRNGAREDAAQAVTAVEHLLLRDRDPATGLFFQHGREHRSGVVEPGHHWAEGLAEAAAWLCDPWLEDEARTLACRQLEAFGRMDLDAALPRSLGWALTALCALHPVAPEAAQSRKAITRIERFVLSRQTDAGHFMLEPSTAREGGFRVSPFVDGGILLPALERASRITRNPATAAAVSRAREALWRDGVAREPDGAVLVSSILIAPLTGRVVARRGRAEGEEIVLFLSGIAGRGIDALEAALLTRAESSLALDERIFLGKPISMLLRALPAYEERKRGR
jgi:hypothetical protein